MANSTVHVHLRVDPSDRKAMAALMMIRDLADDIAQEQPWNDDAKAIRKLARLVLKRAVKVEDGNG